MKILAPVFIFIFLAGFCYSIDFDHETNIENMYSEAVDLYMDGSYLKSVDLLKEIIDKDNKDKYIFASLLRDYDSLVLNRDYDKADSNMISNLAFSAKNYAKQAAYLYPGDKKFLYWYAEFSRAMGDVQEFFNALEAILKTDGTDVYANFNIGSLYLANKEYKIAREYFINAVAYQDLSDETQFQEILGSYFNLGYIYFNDNNYRLAAQNFEKARALYSSDYELTGYLGLCYAGLLDYTNAINNFRQIPVDLLTEDEADIFAGALFLDNQNISSLESKFSNSLYIDSVNNYLNRDYSNSLSNINRYIDQKNYAGIYSQFLLYLDNTALGNIDKSLQNAVFIGTAAKEAGNFDVAIEYFKKLENVTNFIPEIYWYIATIYDDKDDYTNAIKYYNLYLKNPDEAKEKISAFMRLFYLYYKSGNPARSHESILAARKFAVNGEDLFEIDYYSGLINMENKSFKTAAEDFEKAISLNTNDVKLHFLLGSVYYEMNDMDKSIGVLEKGLAIDAKEPDIDNLLAYLYSLKNIKLDEALELANSALAFQNDNYAYLDTLGWIYYRKGDFQKSFEIYNRILVIIENQSDIDGLDEIYYHLGKIYKEMGDPADSKRYLQLGYSINPKNEFILKEMKQ